MPKRKARKNVSLQVHLLKIVLGLGLLLFLVILAGVLAHRYVTRPRPVVSDEKAGLKQPKPPLPAPKVPKRKKPPAPAPKPKPAKLSPFEIYPKEEAPPITPLAKPKPQPDQLPKVAIIIDDLGNDQKIAAKFLSLDTLLTFSLVPHSPYSKQIARKAKANGFDIMLHLPMEPNEYPRIRPGPGTLLASMTPDELLDQLKKNLDDIPHLKGVNNHMGSKMTTLDAQMNQIFTIIKKRGLYFIDSRTTKETLGRQSARLLRVPFAERDIFLDHVQTPEFIRKQIKRLVKIAYNQGEAVGIGHPHILTYRILKETLAELKSKVRIVPASEVVHILG